MLTSGNAQQKNTKLIPKNFPDFGIRISLPQNWTYQEGSENMSNKLFKSFYKDPENKTPFNTASVSISYETIKTPTHTDTIFNQIKRVLTKQAKNNAVTDYPGDKIQGRPTKIYKYSFSINEYQVTSISTYFIKQNILFCYNATAFTDKLESYEQIFKTIAASINIDNLVPAMFTNTYELKKVESRYVNNKHGFAINLPIGSYYLEEIMGNAVQVEKTNSDKSGTISMGVNVQEDFDIKMTSEEYNKFVVRAVKAQLSVDDNGENINSKKFSHPSLEAHKSYFTTFVNNKIQTVFMYTTFKAKKGYLFIAVTDERLGSENERLFDATFKSMTIE
jgi:predicted 3-demethylubiquinone-9 3-methyltransferase (glyoxalase superfamily)